MFRILLTAAIAFAVVCTAQFAAAQMKSQVKDSATRYPLKAGAALSFDADHKDFGRIEEGEKVKVSYEVTNNTDRDIQITRIKPSCGCTALDDNPDMVPANESVLISVKFDSTRRVGETFKSVSIETDDPVQNMYRVSFEGLVTTDVQFEEKYLEFGEVTAGEGAVKKFRLLNTGEDDFKIKDVASDNDTVEVEFLEKVDYIDEESGEKLGKAYVFQASIPESAADGNLFGHITVETTHSEKKQLRHNFRARVVGEFQVAPRQITAIMDKNSKIRRSVMVIARESESFEITGINVPDELDAEITSKDLEDPRRKQLTATIEAGEEIGRFQGNVILNIKTADGKETPLAVPYLKIVREIQRNPRLVGPQPMPQRPQAAAPAGNQSDVTPN